jgi:hypothetical protein
MKKTAIILVSCGLLVGFLPATAGAIPGDVNDDGIVWTEDVAYLLNYLFQNGPPPPNPIDADVDGSPGINLGDVFQLIGHLFAGCDLLPYTGASVRVGSDIRFSSDLIFPMDTLGNVGDTTLIKIIANGGPNLTGMVIPLSFASEPGEVQVTLDNVSFDGTIAPSPWSKSATIDNVEKRVLLYLYANSQAEPSIPTGTTGLVATLYFTKVVDGDALAISTTEIPPSHSFTLMSAYCADGTSPSERIFTPMVSLALNGDVNCDGIIDLGDAVYTLNYLFKGGPPPCGL